MKEVYTDILCIVPVYNEQNSINKIVTKLRTLENKIDFVIIDDGSIDDSYTIAKELSVNVIKHIFNLGLGYAIQTGIRYAVDEGYSYVIRLDGDGQHDPKSIKKFISDLMEDKADMIIGTRYYKGSMYKYQFWNVLGTYFFSKLLQIKINKKITDPTSGFIGMKVNVANRIFENSPQDYPEIESILIANKIGYRIKEIPISMCRREYGKSSLTFWKKVIFIIKQTFLILFYEVGENAKS